MRTVESIYRQIESVPDFAGRIIDSIHYRNGYGDTPIHIVSYWGDCEAIVILVEAGANIDEIGESGFTPLHCAAQMNKPEAITLLLKFGAKILEDENGETPLELAISLEKQEAIFALSDGK